MRKLVVLLALAALLVAATAPAATASEAGAEQALKNKVRQLRGYTPWYVSCHYQRRKGNRRYYSCSGNTHPDDGSYPISAKVLQKGRYRYRVYSLRI